MTRFDIFWLGQTRRFALLLTTILLLALAIAIGVRLASLAAITIGDLLKYAMTELIMASAGAKLLCLARDPADPVQHLLMGWAIIRVIFVFAQGAVGAVALSIGNPATVVYPTIYICFTATIILSITYVPELPSLITHVRNFPSNGRSLYFAIFLCAITILSFLIIIPPQYCLSSLHLASDNATYNVQAIGYLSTGFSPTLAVKAFPHPVLAATLNAISGIGIDKLLGLLLPTTNVIVLAIGCAVLIRSLGASDPITPFVGAVFVLVFANLDWISHYVLGVWFWDGQVSRNILTGQLWLNPYVESMAVAIWGLVALYQEGSPLEQSGSPLARINLMTKVSLLLGSMAYFRPFIYYPLLAGLVGEFAIATISFRRIDRTRLGYVFAVGLGLLCFAYQAHIRAGAEKVPISMPNVSVDPGALQEALLNATIGRNVGGVPAGMLVVVVDDEGAYARSIFGSIAYGLAAPVQIFLGSDVGILGLILTMASLLKKRHAYAAQSPCVALAVVLSLASLAAFTIPSLFRFVPSGANDMLHFALTAYFLSGILFWGLWWEDVKTWKARIIVFAVLAFHSSFILVLIERVVDCF